MSHSAQGRMGEGGVFIEERIAHPARQAAREAYHLLHIGFTALPIIAGLDKFFALLVRWEQYLAPIVTDVVPVSPRNFMMIVGAIEIAAGVLVAIKPRIGGYVVAAWLWGIIINLFLVPGHYDIALRDFGLSIGALALARLAAEIDPARESAFLGKPERR